MLFVNKIHSNELQSLKERFGRLDIHEEEDIKKFKTGVVDPFGLH